MEATRAPPTRSISRPARMMRRMVCSACWQPSPNPQHCCWSVSAQRRSDLADAGAHSRRCASNPAHAGFFFGGRSRSGAGTSQAPGRSVRIGVDRKEETMSANTQLLGLSAVELRRRIGSKEISAVDLLEACIERIEQLNPAVNAMAATCFERARTEARAAQAAVMHGDALGLLHGLPTGIKDLDDTGGLLTTYGSPLYRGPFPGGGGAEA